jgi:hypothetical protein
LKIKSASCARSFWQAGRDEDQLIQKLVELRTAFRLHIERLRTRAAHYPIIPERRQRAAIPPAESIGDSALVLRGLAHQGVSA